MPHIFKRAAWALLFALPLFAGCQALNALGIGGEPELLCHRASGQARLDDRLLGPDGSHLSAVRRLREADELCARPPAAPGAGVNKP